MDPTSVGTSERRAQLVGMIDAAESDLASARRRVTGSPALTAARVVPGLSTQRGGIVRLIDDARQAAGAGRQLLIDVDGLAARAELRDGRVPFEALENLRTQVARAAQAVRGLVRGSDGLWGPVRRARREFDTLLGDSSRRLDHAADVLEVAPGFLGRDGDRTYFVALQNNAEMRDQGMVLSYVVARFVAGRLQFGESGSVGEIRLDRPAPVPIPPGTQEVFGSTDPTRLWQSVNATADFPWSGEAMREMFRQATGGTVDGVIGIDVPGIASLLRVVGAVPIEGVPEPITADSAVRFLLHDQYEGLSFTGDQSGRRERQGDLIEGVVQRLLGGSFDSVALARELGGAARGGHLRLWSATPSEEEVFGKTGLGGGPARERADRTFHVAVENRTTTKLDYYLRPSVRQEIRLTRRGDAVVKTFVVLANDAPVNAAPSYQLGPDENTQRPGDYVAWALLWGPAGSRQEGSTSESGLLLSEAVVPVAAGERVQTTFETVIPNAVRRGRLSLRLVPQSRYEPMDLDVRVVEADGWEVVGPTVWSGPWDRVRNISWRVRR